MGEALLEGSLKLIVVGGSVLAELLLEVKTVVLTEHSSEAGESWK